MTLDPNRADPLQDVLDGHKLASEWFVALQEAGRLLARPDVPPDPTELVTYFRLNVLAHFEFEERRIFPALAAVDGDPELASLLTALTEEHREITLTVGSLLSEMARYQVDRADAEARVRANMLLHKVVESILAHAAREDAGMLPALARNRAAVREWMHANPA
jgi:hypothetical protein